MTSERYRRIWRQVARIPQGRVSTYGRIAALSGSPHYARLVGYALHALPPGMDIPWHRVVNSRGYISLKGRAGQDQRRLLAEENVSFSAGRIDLRVYCWPYRP